LWHPLLLERFIRYMMAPDGVEDSCIRMLRANQINHPALLQEARRRNMVNIVGCYLQILHDIDKNLVSEPVAEPFRALRRKGPRHVFLKQGERRRALGSRDHFGFV
jgi:hypothetical protein